MSFVNVDLFSLVFGLLFLIVSFRYAIGLIIPPLGKRIYGVLWPKAFTDPSQRRAAYLRGIGYSSCYFFFGAGYFLRRISKNVCEIQDTLQLISFFTLPLAIICLLLALIAQRRGGLDQVTTPKNTKTSKLTLAIAGTLSILLLVTCTFAIIKILNHTFEPFERVEMVSPTEGWAVGEIGFNGVMYHYHSGVWTKEPIPAVELLMDISMLSPSEGWAVSNGNTMLHYKNGTWSSIASPVGELTGIDMISPEDGWAVGNYGNILHYRQGAWIQVTSPTTTTLESVSMVSATEGWAVGSGYGISREASVILHYQNGIWKLVDKHLKGPLNRIHMVTADEGWAVGGLEFPSTTSVILHYQHGEWSQEPSPVGIPLTDVSMVSATEGWAVGGGFFHAPLGCTKSIQSVEMNALIHYVNGRWTKVASPTNRALRGVSMISGDAGLIAGWNTFLRYVDGTWKEE